MELRIVGLATHMELVTVQARLRKTDEWHQESMSFDRFDHFFKTHFPNYYKFYEMAKEMEENEFDGFTIYASDSADWFYHFGESEEMRVKGEAFVFST